MEEVIVPVLNKLILVNDVNWTRMPKANIMSTLIALLWPIEKYIYDFLF